MKKIYFLLFLIPYFILFFFKLDSIPMIAMDEGWFAFYAYDEFGQNPYPTSSNIQYKLFFLYPFLLSLWMKVFGISLFAVRAFSVVIGAVGVIGLYKLLKVSHIKQRFVYGGLFAFLMTNIVFITFRWGRPEGVILVLLIWAIYYLLNALKEKKERLFIFVGLLLGLMVLAHPYSVLVPMSFLLILWRMPINLRSAYLYLIYGGGIVVFLMALKGLVFDFDYVQTHLFSHVFDRVSLNSSSQPLLSRLIYFWDSYTLGVKRLYILLFEIIILIVGFFRYRKDPIISNLSLLGLITFILGLLFLSPFRRRYMGIVMVFSLLTSIFIVIKEKNSLKKGVVFAMFLYVSNNMLGNFYYSYTHINNTSYQKLSHEIREYIPQNAKILAPIQFWIALSPYYTITDIHDQIRLKDKQKVDLDSFDYIVWSPYFLKNVSPTTGGNSIGYNLSEDVFYNVLNNVEYTQSWSLVKELGLVPYRVVKIFKKDKL